VELTGTRGRRAGADALAYVHALPRSWRLAVGFASMSLGAACFARFGLSGRAVVDAFFVAVLVLLSAIDLDCRLIPNVIVLPALTICLVAQIALFPDRALEWMLAAFLAALFLFLPLLIVPTGMGMGDVKLAALLGAVLGKSVGAAIFVGLVAGGLFSLAVLVREGMRARKKTIPYGPFIAFGGIVVILLGGR
jgi:leader peptidase (prepilin peptidase)/N-methyltransferase